MIGKDSKKFFKIDRKQNFQFPNLAEYFVYQIRQKRKSNRARGLWKIWKTSRRIFE